MTEQQRPGRAPERELRLEDLFARIRDDERVSYKSFPAVDSAHEKLHNGGAALGAAQNIWQRRQEYPSTSELSRTWPFGKIQPPAIEWDGWPAEELAAHPSLT